jgi:hypothetical protein
MDDLFAPPPPDPRKSERDTVLEERLYEALAARDRLNRDTESRVDEFAAAALQDNIYDPVFIEYFTNTQQSIAELTADLARIRAGGINRDDVRRTKDRISSMTPFFTEQPESISKSIATLDKKTSTLIQKTIPAAISELEKEMAMNRTLKLRVRALESKLKS